MSEVNVESTFDNLVKNADRQRYHPRQLIHLVRKGPAALPLDEHMEVLFEQFKNLIELQVLSTELVATEGRRHAPDRNFHQDICDCYTQEFKFAERDGKTIYNAFREMRTWDLLKKADVQILIIEPSRDYMSAVDAWSFRAMTLTRIRNAHVPRRDLANGLCRDPEGKDVEKFTTTIALFGELQHFFTLMDEANAEMRRMNLVGVDPMSVPKFDPSTSAAHCNF